MRFYVLTKIIMIPNKNVMKIKEKLWVITEKIQELSIELKKLSVDSQWRAYNNTKNKIEELKLERNHLINLINIIDG